MLKSKKFTLTGQPVKILQASWDVTMLRTELEEQYTATPPTPAPLAFFAQNLYPALAACTEPMPTLEEAYAAAEQWDDWYLLVRAVNPSWFADVELTEEPLTFSNKTRIVIQSQRPSVLMRKEQLEYDAAQLPPLENTRRELFRAVYYPMLAGCSVGDVPASEYARTQMAADDIQAWYDAAKRQNPDWFTPLEEIAARHQAESKAQEKKSETPA